MKYKIFLSIFILFLIPVAFSLDVYVRPPRIVARMNVTPGITSTYNGFLEVKNLNNFTVNVTLEPQGELIGKVQLDENLVTLEPGELRTINFTINVKQPGTYQGVILVVYTGGNTPAVALQAEIIIIAKEVENVQKNNILKYSIIGFIFLVTIILVLFLFKKRGVRWGKKSL